MPWPPLDDALCPLAVIRTAFETVDVFPNDVELRGDLNLMIGDARRGLVDALAKAREETLARSDAVDTKLQGLRRQLLRLINDGIERWRLDEMLPGETFGSPLKGELTGEGSSENTRFRYRLGPEHSRGVDHLPPHELLAQCLADLVDAARAEDSYRDGRTFDRCVAEKYFALRFVLLASGDPYLFGDLD